MNKQPILLRSSHLSGNEEHDGKAEACLLAGDTPYRHPKRTLKVAVVIVCAAVTGACSTYQPELQQAPALLPEVTVPAPVLAEAGGSCQPSETTDTPSKATITLTDISPNNGGAVNEGTVIKASLTYSLPAYAENRYRVTAQFETTTQGMTIDGTFPGGRYPWACGISGTLSLVFPLHHVWNISTIKRPIRMVFYLLENNGASYRVIARSEWSEFTQQS